MEQKTSKTRQKLTFTASEWNQLEWGCPNGTQYPPRQPMQTPQVMCAKPFT